MQGAAAAHLLDFATDRALVAGIQRAEAAADVSTGAAADAGEAARAAAVSAATSDMQATRSETAAGTAESAALAAAEARDLITGMTFAAGAVGSGVSWDPATGTLTVEAGRSMQVLTFAPADLSGYEAALAAHAGDPFVLVVRHGA